MEDPEEIIEIGPLAGDHDPRMMKVLPFMYGGELRTAQLEVICNAAIRSGYAKTKKWSMEGYVTSLGYMSRKGLLEEDEIETLYCMYLLKRGEVTPDA